MPYLDQALQAVLLCASITLHPRILFSRIPLNKECKHLVSINPVKQKFQLKQKREELVFKLIS